MNGVGKIAHGLVPRVALLIAPFVLLFSAPAVAEAPAAVETAPITIGELHSWTSPAFGAERKIAVYLPSDYAEGEQTYPVLYLIDGGLEQDFLHIAGTSQLGALWARSKSVIVVGLETVDRRRELTGPTADPELLARYPTAGESALFRRYIRDEIKPFIQNHYRTSGEDGVIGESLAGLFILETLLEEPDLFDAYAAMSPSLWWDDQRLANSAEQALAAAPAGDRRLYLAMADEGDEMQQATGRFVAALERHSRVASLCYVPRPDLAHGTIYHAVSPQALQYLFPSGVEQDPLTGFTLPCEPSS